MLYTVRSHRVLRKQRNQHLWEKGVKESLLSTSLWLQIWY